MAQNEMDTDICKTEQDRDTGYNKAMDDSENEGMTIEDYCGACIYGSECLFNPNQPANRFKPFARSFRNHVKGISGTRH